MKKTAAILLGLLCIVLMTGGVYAQEMTREGASDPTVLTAYFSVTGHTKPLAEYAAEYYDADLYEIQAAVSYTDADIDYKDPDSRSSLEQKDPDARPEIAGELPDMERYDTIVLAYPIWWGEAPRIIYTFLESCDLSGKTVIPFCTSASSDIGSSEAALEALTDASVNWVEGKRFAIGTDQETLIRWLENIG